MMRLSDMTLGPSDRKISISPGAKGTKFAKTLSSPRRPPCFAGMRIEWTAKFKVRPPFDSARNHPHSLAIVITSAI